MYSIVWDGSPLDPYKEMKLSCRKETARCFVSLDQDYSRSFELILLRRTCESPY